VAILPTGAALYFVRPFPAFWRAFAGGAVLLTLTILAAVAVHFADRHGVTSPLWSPLALLRILAAVPLASLYFLGGIFAPLPFARWTLFVCSGIEAVGFAALIGAVIFSQPRL
jgi:hypothetical protein